MIGTGRVKLSVKMIIDSIQKLVSKYFVMDYKYGYENVGGFQEKIQIRTGL